MSCKKPEVAQGLGRMKTERDRRIVASIEACRRKMLRVMTSARKDGIKEKYFKERKEQTKGIRKKGKRKCEKVQKLVWGKR